MLGLSKKEREATKATAAGVSTKVAGAPDDAGQADLAPEVDEVARLEGEIARLTAEAQVLDAQAQAVVTTDPDKATELDIRAAGLARTVERLRKAILDELERQKAAEADAECASIDRVAELAARRDADLAARLQEAVIPFARAWNALVAIAGEQWIADIHHLDGGSIIEHAFEIGRRREIAPFAGSEAQRGPPDFVDLGHLQGYVSRVCGIRRLGLSTGAQALKRRARGLYVASGVRPGHAGGTGSSETHEEAFWAAELGRLRAQK